MKKIAIFISILAVSISSCTLPSNKGGKSTADIQRNERKIETESTSAEEIEKDLEKQIQDINNRITKVRSVGLTGSLIGILGVIIALLAYRKRTHINIKRLRELINKEIAQNQAISHKIKCMLNASNNNQQPNYSITQQQIAREIENYINSQRFKEQLNIIIRSHYYKSSQINVPIEQPLSTTPLKTEVPQPTVSSYELYARESSSMLLSNIQSSYQKGKSIYKLILENSNSNTAKISLCVEHEDAQARILAYDNQYLEPICVVSRMSNQPTTVEIKSMGMAEKINSEEWRVIKQIIVEIK